MCEEWRGVFPPLFVSIDSMLRKETGYFVSRLADSSRQSGERFIAL